MKEQISIEGWCYGINRVPGTLDVSRPPVIANPEAGALELVEWGLAQMAQLEVLMEVIGCASDLGGMDDTGLVISAIRHFTQQAHAAISAGADRMKT
jgi:hypothetical protein